MVCTHTLYNEVWAGNLDLSVTELPEAMKRGRYKDSVSILHAMQSLRNEYGEKFAQVFVDNGSEFSGFAQVENWGSQIYFAHPYTSWERPQNERHNGLFRAFVPETARCGARFEGAPRMCKDG